MTRVVLLGEPYAAPGDRQRGFDVWYSVATLDTTATDVRALRMSDSVFRSLVSWARTNPPREWAFDVEHTGNTITALEPAHMLDARTLRTLSTLRQVDLATVARSAKGGTS